MISSSDQNSRPRVPAPLHGHPEFRVRFSRAAGPSSLFETSANSFRWSGYGTLRIHEYGVIVLARSRNLMGLQGTQEHPVQARDICDVYREGACVRLDLRSASPGGSFFQFWTQDAATAATIVRLLPTTRTFELEASTDHHGARKTARQLRPHVSTGSRVFLGVLCVIGAVTWLTGLVSRHYLPAPNSAARPQDTTVTVPAQPSVSQPATAAQAAARIEFERIDSRIEVLEAQFATSFAELQSGSLPQDAFISSLEVSLAPKWHSLFTGFGADARGAASLPTAVQLALLKSTLAFEDASRVYALGLKEQDPATVIAAFNRMRDAEQSENEARQQMEQFTHGAR